ncbi:MAG: ATPase [Actinomycetota bacterium]|nr:ATPase [Actinomycetota bacterium]
MQTQQSPAAVADRIERSIHIEASPQRVWALIARPGWWINEGTVTDLPTEVDGDVSTVTHPTYGEFRIQTVTLDDPRYAAYRWLGGEAGADGAADAPTTLVEFWIDEQDGGVSLRVVESGFASLPGDDADRHRAFEENDQGWEQELRAARAHVTGSGGA